MQNQSNHKKHVIISTQRSGSGYLVNLLNSHPELRFFNEPFGYHIPKPFTLYNFAKDRYKFEALAKCCAYPNFSKFNWNVLSRKLTQVFLKNIENGQAPFDDEIQKPIRGFNTMYGNVNNNYELSKWMAQKEVKVIHLVRKNLLCLLISKHIKDQTQVAHITHEKVVLDFKPIHLDIAHTLWQLKSMDGYIQGWRAKLNRENYLEVCYEEIGNKETQREILNFLNVPILPLTSIQNKINNKKVNEVVLNYDALKESLRDTKFAWMLEE